MSCSNCPGHVNKSCKVTMRKKKPLRRRPKKNFWDGVQTRSNLASMGNKLTKLKKLEKEKKELEKNSDICVICQDQCLQKDDNTTPCGHVFHTGCLLGWLKNHNTCPCCRTSLYDKPEKPDQEVLQNLVENIVTMHYSIDPESTDTINFTSQELFVFGDEVARLAAEEVLNEDLDWGMPGLEDDSDMPDLIEVDSDMPDLVVDSDIPDLEDVDMQITPYYYPTLDTSGYNDHRGEEKVPENTELPNWDTAPVSTHQGQFWVQRFETEFIERTRYDNVMSELLNRSSFMEAWNVPQVEQSTQPIRDGAQSPLDLTPIQNFTGLDDMSTEEIMTTLYTASQMFLRHDI
jgi:hypothetical protein